MGVGLAIVEPFLKGPTASDRRSRLSSCDTARLFGADPMALVLNTSSKTTCLNFGKMALNSNGNGGPFRSLTRDGTSTPSNEFKKEAYELSPEAPKIMCVQWTL